jgi:hypothetical protein
VTALLKDAKQQHAQKLDGFLALHALLVDLGLSESPAHGAFLLIPRVLTLLDQDPSIAHQADMMDRVVLPAARPVA